MGNFSVEGVMEEFEALSKSAVEVQKWTLGRILEENGESEYLRKLGLDGRTDVESFKSCVPLVTHEQLEPYIQRIVDGDSSSILTGNPISNLSLSSGTTQGKPKYIPFNERLLDNTMQIFTTSYAFRNRDLPIGKGKALQFNYGSKMWRTKGGIAVATATTNVYSSKSFRTTMSSINSECSSPQEVIFSPDYKESMYCHILCALLFADEIQFISSSFAHRIVQAFRAFEDFHDDICRDIRDGVLSARITTPATREAVSRLLLRPNPALAGELYDKCKSLDDWYGVIPTLFPNAKYVYAIMTGTMEPYIGKLRHYAGDRLPLVSADYGASEGWIGVNVFPTSPPETASFAVLPNMGYFEFIPVAAAGPDAGDDVTNVDPIGLGDLKIGEEYEVLLTNFAGLYRYRLGDVVKIVGFYNSTPLMRFLYRRSLVLSINIDKNTEKDLQNAVEETVALVLTPKKLEVVDFTSYVDFSTEPAHYVIFWELNEGAVKADVLRDCTDTLDQAFVDVGYRVSRKTKAIGPLELRLLKGGTFQKILEHFVSLGGTVGQLKTPRCVPAGNKMVLQILNDNVVAKHFSTAYE